MHTRPTHTCCRCGTKFTDSPCRHRSYCGFACYWAAKRVPIADRLWRKVRKGEGCWLWTGSKNHGGYGIICTRLDGRHIVYLAHRVSWEFHHGAIPEGLHVLHNCPGGDNPACVNPAHLWLGTQRDNNNDKMKKSRQGRGEQYKSAKLTNAKVEAILKRYAVGNVSQRQLATEFGVSQQRISKVINRLVWSHVKDSTLS